MKIRPCIIYDKRLDTFDLVKQQRWDLNLLRNWKEVKHLNILYMLDNKIIQQEKDKTHIIRKFLRTIGE